MTETPPGASPVDAIAPGTRLREWEVVRFVGRGSYGVVFEAQRSSWLDEPPRALKVFDPIVSGAARSALLDEFTALTRARHPHLLAGIDAFDLVDPPFAGCVVFVLELADEDLAHRVARTGPLPPTTAATVIADVADGLAALHAEGRIHGDVKPENILRVGDRWTLGDFGVTSVLEGSYAVTRGATIDYRSPEQARASEGSRQHRSADVWALGVSLHVAATGRHPFPGPDPMMRFAAVVRGERVSVPELDPRLAAVIDDGCLAADPRGRLAAASLAARLRALAAPTSSFAPAVGRPAAPEPAAPREPAASPAPAAARWQVPLAAALLTLAITQVVAVACGAVLDGVAVRRVAYTVVTLGIVAGGVAAYAARARTGPDDAGRPAPVRLVAAAALAVWLVATIALFV